MLAHSILTRRVATLLMAFPSSLVLVGWRGAIGGEPPPGHPKVAAGAKANDDGSKQKLKVRQLIDKLQEESAESAGDHWASAFLALDEEPPFFGGSLDFKKANRSAVMQELVRSGLAALPEVIEHLDDNRPTKLVVRHGGGSGAMWQSDEYDPRYPKKEDQPRDVNTKLKKHGGFEQGEAFEKRYTLRVGDLCFIFVGQIVNRRLDAARAQPTRCIVINSPVQTPALAAAVKKDWAGLTAENHRRSLEEDAYKKRPFATGAAMRRLMFYYPEHGQELAAKLLNRPLYEDDELWAFIEKRLTNEENADRWKDLIADFRKQHGAAAADALPFRLHWIYWQTSFKRDEQFLKQREIASRILKQLYPTFDPQRPPFINAATAFEQHDLVESLRSFESDKIDKAIFGLFDAVRSTKMSNARETRYLDYLGAACVSRLIGKGRNADLRAYVKVRIDKAGSLLSDDPLTESLSKLRERLK